MHPSSWSNTYPKTGFRTGKVCSTHSAIKSPIISPAGVSLSGKFVVWVNEQGIKVMRSNLHLNSEHLDHAWRRIAHIDRPSRPQWEDMAGVWRARCEWIEDNNLESDDEDMPAANGSNAAASLQLVSKADRSKKKRVEKLVVGWGDTAWVLRRAADAAAALEAAQALQAFMLVTEWSGVRRFYTSE